MDGDQTMKLTEQKLKQIIKEEIAYIYQEDAAETQKAMEEAPKVAMAIAEQAFEQCQAISEKSKGAISPDALAGMVAEFLSEIKP